MVCCEARRNARERRGQDRVSAGEWVMEIEVNDVRSVASKEPDEERHMVRALAGQSRHAESRIAGPLQKRSGPFRRAHQAHFPRRAI
jgi:hypothetical protein